MAMTEINMLKMVAAALFTVVMFFAGSYTNALADSMRDQQAKVDSHETRITTLEESKRNTEQILRDMREQLQRIENAVTVERQNRSDVRSPTR